MSAYLLAIVDRLSQVVPSSLLDTATDGGSSLMQIARNIGWLLFDKLLNLVAGFLVGVWVARYLGRSLYGSYSYALAFVSLFAPLAGLGLRDIVIRNIVREPEDKNSILGTALILQLAGGMLALGLAIGIIRITRSEDLLARTLVAILSIRLVFLAFSQTVDYWFQSRVEARYVVWARSIGLVVIAVLKVGLILSGASLVAFAWAALGQGVILAVAAVAFHSLRGHTVLAWHASATRAKELVRNSWPLAVSALAIVVYMRLGEVMLGNMAGSEALGVYSAAVRLSELWYFMPTAVAASVFPAVVRSRENHSAEVYDRRMQLFYDVMAGMAYIIVIPLVVLAPLLVQTLFGPEFAEAGPILRAHAWAYLFVSLGVARSGWLVAADMIHFSMWATVLGAVVNVGLNLLLIPRYSGVGAAWAATLSQAVSAYLSSVLTRPLWPVFGQLSRALLVPFRIPLVKKSLDTAL